VSGPDSLQMPSKELVSRVKTFRRMARAHRFKCKFVDSAGVSLDCGVRQLREKTDRSTGSVLGSV
jgi:hypothetical protein